MCLHPDPAYKNQSHIWADAWGLNYSALGDSFFLLACQLWSFTSVGISAILHYHMYVHPSHKAASWQLCFAAL